MVAVKTPMSNVYNKALIEVFGASVERHMNNGLVNYMAWMDSMITKNGDKQNYMIGKKIIAYSSVFDQIEKGGHIFTTPEGREVRGIVLFSQVDTIKKDGKEYWRNYVFAPQFGLGDLVVMLSEVTESDKKEAIVEHGLSYQDGKSMLDLFESLW